MSRLTEDLLTLAAWNRANTGSTCSVSAPKELLRDALESFREVARPYGVELAMENSAPDGHVKADREAIHQIFSNLIERTR